MFNFMSSGIGSSGRCGRCGSGHDPGRRPFIFNDTGFQFFPDNCPYENFSVRCRVRNFPSKVPVC